MREGGRVSVSIQRKRRWSEPPAVRTTSASLASLLPLISLLSFHYSLLGLTEFHLGRCPSFLLFFSSLSRSLARSERVLRDGSAVRLFIIYIFIALYYINVILYNNNYFFISTFFYILRKTCFPKLLYYCVKCQ